MKIIVFSTIASILLLQAFGLIPMSSIEGPLVIAMVVFAGAIAVGLHEAWTEKRGVLGWLLNIVIVLVSAFFAAQAGGMLMVLLLKPYTQQSSLAAAGGGVMMVALIGAVITTLFGVWGALRLVKRWRTGRPAA